MISSTRNRRMKRTHYDSDASQEWDNYSPNYSPTHSSTAPDDENNTGGRQGVEGRECSIAELEAWEQEVPLNVI